MLSIKAILAASVMAFTTANAHMIMAKPIPFGSPNNSPLLPSGSDFPCKGSSSSGGTVNKMTIGSPNPLTFTGSAVHGGGSCQISLTKDNPATKSSKWQVIHSIEGGCPAKQTASQAGGQATGGNLPEGSNDGSTYSFTIPDGITPGAYTLGWTWFNNVGNREMYMNCALVDISGGSKKREFYHPHANQTMSIPSLDERDTSFPNMFVANIPKSTCQSIDSKDVQFPDPGSSVEKFGANPSNLVAPSGPKCSAGPAAAGGGSGTSASTGGASSGSGSVGAGAGTGAGAGSGSGAAPSAAASGASSAAAGGAAAPSGAAGGAGGTSSAAVGGAPSAAAGGPAAPSVAADGAPSAAAGGASAPSAAAAPSNAASSAPFANSSAAVAAPSSSASASGSTSGAAAAPAAAAGSSTGSCTTAGASICSPDGKQIGTCTSQMTVTWIPVADGTKCSGGMMVMANASKLKTRSAKFLRALGF